MEENTQIIGVTVFDKDTPKITDASKVKSLLATNTENELIGSVDFDLLVIEAGKTVSDAVKLTTLILPELGDANKSARVLGGESGKKYTYGSVELDIPANYEGLVFWDGVLKTWSIQDLAPLPMRELANGFNDFSVGKSSSAEQTGILNTYNKLFFSTSTDPYIDSNNVLNFGLSYIFSGASKYARISAGTFNLTPYITSNPSGDRLVISIPVLGLLKRESGSAVDIYTTSYVVSKYNEGLWMDKDQLILYIWDRSTGVLQSPFISAKRVINDFGNRSVNLAGSSENDYVLNTNKKLMYSMIVDPYIHNNILYWANGFIFNASVGYISVNAGTLDLTPFISASSAADRYYIYVNDVDVLRRARTTARIINASDLIVEEFRSAQIMNKSAILMFEWDRASNTLKTPFFNQSKSVDVGINYHKFQYTSRASFNFDKTNRSISWSDRLYIFNRGFGGVSTYVRLEPGAISFAQKVAQLPTDEWFVAYINSGTNFIYGQGSGGLGTITPENVIIKGWTEDTSEVRRREFIPVFYYNKALNTIQSPFLEELVHTKALESTASSATQVSPWFNKYPNVTKSLSKFNVKYLYSFDQLADSYTRIILLGDSLLARHQHTTELNIDPKQSPPCLITKNFGAYLWETLKGNKPIYKRYDSGFISENSTFDLVEANSGWDDSGDIYGAVKSSSVENASISFEVPAEFNYFNFIDRKHRVLPSDNIVIQTLANGILQCRIEGDDLWSEANGFVFSQLHPTSNTSLGIGNTQFQRRIEFKKIGTGINNPVSVTIANTVLSTNFYYWGVELIPNGKRYTQVINVARGGHTLNTSSISLSHYIQSDVYDRKPDLVILEVPLLNMLATSVDLNYNVNSFIDFVYGDRIGFENPMSLKNKSNNWSDFQVLIIIPHHSRVHYNSANVFPVQQASGYTMETLYNAIKGEIYKRGDLPFIDISTAMTEAIKADPLYNGDFWNALRTSNQTGDGYMNDSLHQNNKGTLVWAKEICPIFWGNTN